MSITLPDRDWLALAGIEWGDERLPERYWSKVYPCPLTGCWHSSASPSQPYAHFAHTADHNETAHRVAWRALVGPIPDGFHVDHLCRVTCCVRPLHLEPVTIGTNVLRGGGITATYARLERCTGDPSHPFDEANTYVTPDGRRQCRKCLARRSRECAARRRARLAVAN